MNNQRPPVLTQFLVTKEYRRFAEFCDACRRHQYIGLCYGPPGVGKTLSAHYYARWDVVLAERRRIFDDPPAPEPFERRTVVYTAPVVNTPQVIARELTELCQLVDSLVRWGLAFRRGANDILYKGRENHYTELIIVDEADRLKTAGLEQVRDLYDRGGLGLVLIGMPGIEKRLARYPQLYSRVGFVHQFRPLSRDELQFGAFTAGRAGRLRQALDTRAAGPRERVDAHDLRRPRRHRRLEPQSDLGCQRPGQPIPSKGRAQRAVGLCDISGLGKHP
jgi:hypothetical protein